MQWDIFLPSEDGLRHKIPRPEIHCSCCWSTLHLHHDDNNSLHQQCHSSVGIVHLVDSQETRRGTIPSLRNLSQENICVFQKKNIWLMSSQLGSCRPRVVDCARNNSDQIFLGKYHEKLVDTHLHLVQRLVETTFHRINQKIAPFSSKNEQFSTSCIICLPCDVTKCILSKYFTKEEYFDIETTSDH